jgi:hypothetical protein
LSEIYDLWTDSREDTFLERILRKHPLVVFWVTSLVASEASHSVHVTIYIYERSRNEEALEVEIQLRIFT